MTDSPHVSVVVATRDRPEMLRRALASIAASHYPGMIDTIVVFDQSEPDPSLAVDDPTRPVQVITNERTPGLAGARNSGALIAAGQYLAFLDDDDEWMPSKIASQVAALAEESGAKFATCGISIRFGDEDNVRLPEQEKLTFTGFLRDRMTEVHPSSFLMDRRWFLYELGLVDEELPGSYAEDYDLLLRATRLTQIVSADAALVRVWWHEATYFRDRWHTIDKALGYLTEKFPEFASEPHALARIRGQQAFALAAAGDRRASLTSVRESLRRNPLEPRAYVATAVAAGVPARLVLNTLHRFGRGV